MPSSLPGDLGVGFPCFSGLAWVVAAVGLGVDLWDPFIWLTRPRPGGRRWFSSSWESRPSPAGPPSSSNSPPSSYP